MKKIAITGSHGKTTMAEMLFSYLSAKNYRVLIFCSNGIFDNCYNLVLKDYAHTMSDGLYDKFFVEFEDDYDYCIVELQENWAYYERLINQEHFNLLINASYSETITSFHIKEHPDFGKKYLNELNTDNILIFDEDVNVYNLSRPYQTYSLFNNCVSTFSSSSFTYQNKTYETSIIGSYMLKSLAGVTRALEVLEEFDEEIYINFLMNILVRGRFEKHIINNNYIIIDNCWRGIDDILSELFKNNIFTTDNTIVLFVPYPHEIPASDGQKQYRQNIGEYWKNNNLQVILTNSADKEETLAYFKEEYCNTGFSNYIYISDLRMAIETAIANPKTNILICGNYYYRLCRHIIEELEQ